MNKIGLIILREFLSRVRKRSFLIMTLLGPILIAGGITLVIYLGMSSQKDHLVLVVDKAHLFTDKLKGTEKVHFVYQADDISDSAFKAGPFTELVDANEAILENNTIQIFYKELPGLSVQRTIQSEMERVLEREKLRVNHVDPEIYAQIKTALNIQLFDIDNTGKESLEQEKAGIGFFFGYLIFIFIFMYGVQVMRGVMEEKQNRIVEVLISSVKPFQLMMGKIVGIALVGLTQFLLWIVLSTTLISAGSALLLKDKFDPKELAGTPMTGQMQQRMADQAAAMPASDDVKLLRALGDINITATVAMFIFYFLAGYLLYSSLFAAVGSAVDSETDTQQFMFPVTIPMILAIFIAQMAVTNPSSPMVFWGSIIPFTSPVVMMVRVAMGNAFTSPMDLLLSMSLLIATFVLTTWLAGRIYRTGILMYGKKVSWKELGKWVFYKG
ncbi:MAG: ABC transporter permease [Flavobacteriales bacterium]|nr:ABC transporter permease [Flavobacteriales bacterium]MCB9192935.1 ABC transporter permease [Flavobacteriales bacterium]